MGDLLRALDGTAVPIERLVRRGGTFTVYSLQVAGAHTYFVSTKKVLVHNKAPKGNRGIDPNRPASQVLSGSLKRKFPGQHLSKSLNQIKKELRTATGAAKKSLQTAKKLLEQQDRLLQY